MSAQHAMILPVVLPLCAAAVAVLLERARARLLAPFTVATSVLMVVLAVYLLGASEHATQVYLLGNWQAPFGIVLVLDRFSALMLLLSAVVLLIAHIYALAHEAKQGAHFHALLLLQAMGLNGAFLTGDIFNLFVFFEVMLISSYGLLLHGARREAVGAGFRYISINLLGSALFLVAASMLYGVVGTLNMADLAEKLAVMPADRQGLASAACLLLLLVFVLKSALLPLNFWLPATYSSAPATSAAVFVLLSKVGVYAIWRVSHLWFDGSVDFLESSLRPWLLNIAVLSLLVAGLAALAVRRLRSLVACLAMASSANLLLALSLGSAQALAGGVIYLLTSTLACAGLFLVAERISAMRGSDGDLLRFSRAQALPGFVLAALFGVLALAAVSFPPFASFFGKALILKAAIEHPSASWIMTGVLLSSFLMLLAVVRGGLRMFFEREAGDERRQDGMHGVRGVILTAVVLAVLGLLLSLPWVGGLSERITRSLRASAQYREAVLEQQPVPPKFDVRKEMRAREQIDVTP
jgi:multicomponent K+:H+ antiporter subunit D